LVVKKVEREMNNAMKQAVILNLEQQKSILIQELNTYTLTNQEEAAIETKRDLDEVEKKLRGLRVR
jgi:hypothetical protein